MNLVQQSSYSGINCKPPQLTPTKQVIIFMDYSRLDPQWPVKKIAVPMSQNTNCSVRLSFKVQKIEEV
jgi:hypothetical protein